MKTGGIKFEEFKGLTAMPQKAASAWSGGVEQKGLVGASYKPVLYVGEQLVKGTNYHFIAEQTLVLREPETHLVKMAINEFNGEYSIVKGSIVRIY